MTSDWIGDLSGAFGSVLIFVIVLGAALAIGIEHLIIYLIHHLSIHWL
jgi:hypothetical protein